MGAVWVLMQHYGEHTTQEYTAVAIAIATALVFRHSSSSSMSQATPAQLMSSFRQHQKIKLFMRLLFVAA